MPLQIIGGIRINWYHLLAQKGTHIICKNKRVRKLIMLVWLHVGDRSGYSFFFAVVNALQFSSFSRWMPGQHNAPNQCWLLSTRSAGGWCNSTHLFNNFNYKIVSVCRFSSACGGVCRRDKNEAPLDVIIFDENGIRWVVVTGSGAWVVRRGQPGRASTDVR